MSKFKNSVVTRNSTQLATRTLLVAVIKTTFPSLASVSEFTGIVNDKKEKIECNIQSILHYSL